MFTVKFWYFLPETIKNHIKNCIFNPIFWVIMLPFSIAYSISFILLSIVNMINIRDKMGKMPCDSYIILGYFNVFCNFRNSIFDAFLYSNITVIGGCLILVFLAYIIYWKEHRRIRMLY